VCLASLLYPLSPSTDDITTRSQSKFSKVVTFVVGVGADQSNVSLHEFKLIENSKFWKEHLRDPKARRHLIKPDVSSTTFDVFARWIDNPTVPIPPTNTTTTGWCDYVVDALVLACTFQSEGFVQKLLKLFIECSDHYRNLPHFRDIRRIFESDCGQGIRKLVVDLILHESNDAWLTAEYQSLTATRGGRQFLIEMLARMFDLRRKVCTAANAPYKSRFREYHVDVFGPIDLTEDDEN